MKKKTVKKKAPTRKTVSKKKIALKKTVSKSNKKAEKPEIKRRSESSDDYTVVKTQKELAEFFGVTERTIRDWIGRGMPVEAGGNYSIRKIMGWRELSAKGKGQTSKDTTDESKINWSSEGSMWDAKLKKLKYQIQMKNLFERHEVEEGLVQISLTLKQLFLSLPRNIAPQLRGLDAPEIEELLEARIKEIILQFQNNKIFQMIEESEEDIVSDGDASKAA